MDTKDKYFSLNDFEKIDFLLKLEFDETNEKWNLLQFIIENKHEYDLARIQALKIIEIATIPKYYKDIFVKIIYDIIINENDYGVRNYASSAAINFIEYNEIEKVIIEKVIDSTEDIDIRYNFFEALLKINNKNTKKKILTKLLSDSSFNKAATRNLKLFK